MKFNYQVTPQAEADIEVIARYIAQDNPTAALMMVDRFYDAFQLIGANPGIGHTRTDLTDRDVRFWTVKPRYHVIYSEKVANFPIMLRVLPSDMDLATELIRSL